MFDYILYSFVFLNKEHKSFEEKHSKLLKFYV